MLCLIYDRYFKSTFRNSLECSNRVATNLSNQLPKFRIRHWLNTIADDKRQSF